jgi:asparagine synthase (glutamine-hydrolysing)
MCGIAGIRRFDGAPVDENLLRLMSDQLAHRGPDDAGLLIRDSVGLAHRRLSIIDLEQSTQPMSSADGTLHVCFNGEVLNYRELRRETPYPYRTSGDTEVLLSTFRKHGPRSVEKLRGQFAYALYSQCDDLLWLFRDRLGILPLYYYRDDRIFAFASEVKGLLPALPAEPQLDLASLDAYLARRSVPAPWTLFEHVRKLPAGCFLRVGPDGIECEPETYWRLRAPSRPARVSATTAVRELDAHLRASIRRNLVADVPVGAYLSGGVDSSLIVALMRSVAPSAEIRTFSASFGDSRFDESMQAAQVATRLRTVHEVVRVREEDFLELWPLLTWHRDAPVSEASDVAVYRLAELARRHVKVVLSGEGSDELFAGYPKHRFARMSCWAGAVPRIPRVAALTALERRMPPSAARARVLIRALAGATEMERLDNWFAPFTDFERLVMLDGQAQHPRANFDARTGDALSRMLLADIHGWLSDNLLERGDRMSMAASVELRPPFLDAEVVEWAFSLPSRLKTRAGVGKWVVRQLAQAYLPREIAERKKWGFRVPMDDWLRGALRDFTYDTLFASDSLASLYLSRPFVAELVRRHMEGTANEGLRIWTLLSLEVWRRTCVGRSNSWHGPTAAHVREAFA